MAAYGLIIGSKDLEKAKQLAGRLECGTAWVNGHAAIQPNAPFGGVKESGYGVEFGHYGLEGYESIQTPKIVKRRRKIAFFCELGRPIEKTFNI